MAKALRWMGRGAGLALVASVAVRAQQPEQVPPIVTPPAPVIVLPTLVPTPTPTPAVPPTIFPTPPPMASPSATPTPRASSSPRVTSSPTPSAEPPVIASPTPVASVAPVTTPTPTEVASPASQPSASSRPSPIPAEPLNWWPWLFGAGGLGLLAVLWMRYRRDVPAEREEALGETGAVADAEAPAPVYRTSGPWLTLALRPVRAGLNMVTAVADCEITITNEGGAPAEAIRTALALLAVHPGQEAEIAKANGERIARSVTPVFTLAPGEARTFRGVASANLDLLPTMQAGGRPMLVPLVLLNVQHRDPGGVEHRTSQHFVLGVERVDSPKLAPFWLDSLRMIDQVAARPGGAPERRRIA